MSKKDIQSNSFVYKTLHEESITIKYDHAAVTTGGGGKTDEPAWSFRLWNGSIFLSRYLETIAAESLRNEVVIDLGSGTGLTSIVLGKCCGVRRVFATDLKHAMPLLSHNITTNCVSDTHPFPFEDSESQALPPAPPRQLVQQPSLTPTCPANHVLNPVTADCEDYMCNVCDFDIEEDSCIHRCVECNFDICCKCVAKIMEGDMSSFPDWFTLHLQSQSAPSTTHAGIATTDERVRPFVFDWSSKESLQALVNEVTKPSDTDDEDSHGRVKYIIGADVTYSMKSIDLFFAAVTELIAALRQKYLSSNKNNEDGVTLLFAHHNRSDETNAYMLQQLQLLFNGRYEEVPCEALTREDREDGHVDGGAGEDTGEMKIFRVLFDKYT